MPEYQAWMFYVYLWVCRVPGGTYVKVGMTNDPDRRVREFRTACPFPVTEHFICQCQSRDAAYGLEQLLLHTFRAYRQHGEWVRVPDGQLHRFIGGCTAIARKTVSPQVEFRAHKPRRKRRAAARTASDRTPRHSQG